MSLDGLVRWIDRARARRGPNLAVVNLRILIGFAFVPAGLKKVLGQPFTDPANAGRFHDFLDAFLATGGMYRFVGALQLTAALLLMTQRFAALGAALALPIATAIAAFTWSTARAPTVIVTTLLVLGLAGLLGWDLRRWAAMLTERPPPPAPPPSSPPPIERRLWALCGVAVIAIYLGLCLALGEVYRPRRPTPDSPAYYVMPALALVPLATWALERRRRGKPAAT
ncbi:MAG: hypothetical protein IPL61_07815 [Myxococcales bacterium]|nr:hypothetical protein [Myxococcales bacterium]